MAIDDLPGALSQGGVDVATGPVVLVEDVDVFRWSAPLKERVPLLKQVNWHVDRGEHWVMLGPNGAGKTTLLHLAAADSHPSVGRVSVLGRALGATDMRALRERIGLVDSRTAQSIPNRRPVLETIESGAFNSIALQHRRLEPAHRERALHLLELLGLEELATRRIGDCSQGERQRILLARALMPSPELLLLDEPAAGLDLPSREQLISAMSSMAQIDPGLTTVTVTHHLEEIPPIATHALLIRDGRVLAVGPIEETLTTENVSACFDLGVDVNVRAGRWTAAISS